MNTETNQVAIKIAKIMAEMGTLGKEQAYSFRAHSIGTVTGALRPLMAKHNLSLIPQILSIDTTDKVNKMDLKITLIDGDSGQSEQAHWVTLFNADKSIEQSTGKAISYAVKNFLLRTFMISEEGEDIDFDPPSPTTNTPKTNTPPPPAPAPEPKPGQNIKGEDRAASQYHNKFVTVTSFEWEPRHKEDCFIGYIEDDPMCIVRFFNDDTGAHVIDEMFELEHGETMKTVRKHTKFALKTPLVLKVYDSGGQYGLKPCKTEEQDITMRNDALRELLMKEYRDQHIEGVLSKIQVAIGQKDIQNSKLTIKEARAKIDAYLQSLKDEMNPSNEIMDAWQSGSTEDYNAAVEKHKTSVYGNKEPKQTPLIDLPTHQRAEGAD